MKKDKWIKTAMASGFFLLLLLRVLAQFSLIGTSGMADAFLEKRLLIFDAQAYWMLQIFIALLLFNYILYSTDVILKNKSEYAREFVRIADTGFCFANLFLIPATLAFAYGNFILALIFHLAALVFLLRLPSAYRGNPRRIFLPRLSFDFFLGAELLAAALLSALLLHPFTQSVETAFTIALLFLTAIFGSFLGIRLLSPALILSLIFYDAGLCVYHLRDNGFHAHYPAVYISIILILGLLLTAFITAWVRRRQSFWRG